MTDRQRLVSIIKNGLLLGKDQNDTTGIMLAEFLAAEISRNFDMAAKPVAEQLGRRAPITSRPTVVAN